MFTAIVDAAIRESLVKNVRETANASADFASKKPISADGKISYIF